MIKNYNNKTLEIIIEKDALFESALNKLTNNNEIEVIDRIYIELINGKSFLSDFKIKKQLNDLIFAEEILADKISKLKEED